MKVKSIVLCAVAFVALYFGSVQLGTANDVASSEFSSQVAAESYANSGDMNASVSIENQYVNFENTGDKLSFAASLSCTTGCTGACTNTCTGCCSHKCSGSSYCR